MTIDAMKSRSRRSGFTILEIIIATAILVVGLVGVLALFPVGINVGKQVVEDSTAITLARSVADAIRRGIRNNMRVETRTGDVTFTYFVFQHDGVDKAPADPRREDPRANYYILLPRHSPGRPIQERTESAARQRAAIQQGKTFVYPETDEEANGLGDPFRADDDKDDVPLVTNVYRFGSTMPTSDPDLVDPTNPYHFDDQRIEVLKQYSYAFSIRASIFDSNLDFLGSQYIPGDELYHVRVMIYRSFKENFSPDQSTDIEPVYELDFEVAR